MIEMASIPRMEAQIGSETRLGDGTVVKVDAKGKQLSYVPPTETANHEFEHAALAINKLIKVSVIPGPGYKGITELDSYDEVAFMGPESRGRNGTGYDVSVVEEMGGNTGAAKMTARINLAAIDSEVQRKVAGHLQAEGTLTREGFRNAMRIAQEGTTVETTIITPDGRTIVLEETGVQGENVLVDFRNAIGEEHPKINKKPDEAVESQDETINSIERFLYGENPETDEDNSATLDSVDQFLKAQRDPADPDDSQDSEAEALKDVRDELSELVATTK